jgi:hypothetical protein
MVFSPFRAAISHAPGRPKPGDPFVAPHPRGSRWHPYPDGKVMQVRRLVEQSLHSYAEIGKRTGVSPASISRWASAGSWARPAFAPRASDTVPRWRASVRLKRRTLAARIDALAERAVKELEASPRVDLAKLREAFELLKMMRLAARPQRRGQTRREKASPLTDAQARARVIADLRASGVDIARAPGEAVADFIESCAPGADPTRDPAFRERGRYSKRNKHHAWMLGKG